MVGDKKVVMLLVDDKLDDFLDKLSGYVKFEQCILLFVCYYYLKFEVFNKVVMCWLYLQFDFMMIYVSKGQQVDFVIVLGLQDGEDVFLVLVCELIMEQVFLLQLEDFLDVEECRLLYVVFICVCYWVWLLFNKV